MFFSNAPPSILNVRMNQPVELRVARRTNEMYQAPPKRLEAFAGTGNRLGSPVPAIISSSGSTSLPGSFPSEPIAGSGGGSSTFDESRIGTITTRFEVDQNLPTTSVQIRLADGTRCVFDYLALPYRLLTICGFRLVARMNLTHTVGDIRGFINA